MKKMIPMIVVFAVLAGCGLYDAYYPYYPYYPYDPYYPYYGYDSSESMYYEGGVMGAGADPSPMATLLPAASTPEAMAQNALANLKARLTDKACLISEKVTGSTYEVEMKACKGTFGLLSVTGKAAFTLSEAAGGGTQVDVVSTGLTVNKYLIEINSRAIRTVASGKTTLVVTSKGKVSGPGERAINREGTYTATMTAADECRTLDGNWKLSIADRAWDIALTGYKRCSSLCPASGGQLLMSDQDGNAGHKTAITFDGTGDLKWEWVGHKSGTVPQYCGDKATGTIDL